MQNHYTFKYTHAEGMMPPTLTLTVLSNIGTPTFQGNGCLNTNDWLGGFEIYNALEQLIDVDYAVEATFKDKSKKSLSKAVYDATSDRLVYTATVHSNEAEVCLAQLDTLTFTRSI